jgi:hypothetical protein
VTPILDLTFIEDEQRRVQVADDMALVYDGRASDGVHWRWDHLCSEFDDPVEGRVRKRIASWLARGHVVASEEPLTIEGSLRCGACGLHGWVRDGKWVPA